MLQEHATSSPTRQDASRAAFVSPNEADAGATRALLASHDEVMASLEANIVEGSIIAAALPGARAVESSRTRIFVRAFGRPLTLRPRRSAPRRP